MMAVSSAMMGSAFAEPNIAPNAKASSQANEVQKTSGQDLSNASEAGKININTASASELQSLKGIGKKRAEQIVKDRETNGPFSSPQDLTRIKGIGPKTVEKNLAIISVGIKKKSSEEETQK
jgi:competence protein ComEA